MTTIGIRPKTTDWFQADSATFHVHVSNDPVATGDTLSARPIVHDLREIVWLPPTIDAIGALPLGADGWSSGATRTQPAAVVKLLQVLVDILDSQTPPPFIVPTHEGGVQAEWHRNGVDLEIEATPAGAIEYYFRSPLGEYEERVVGDLSALAQYAQAVRAR